jgi:hypothetical protein
MPAKVSKRLIKHNNNYYKSYSRLDSHNMSMKLKVDTAHWAESCTYESLYSWRFITT